MFVGFALVFRSEATEARDWDYEMESLSRMQGPRPERCYASAGFLWLVFSCQEATKLCHSEAPKATRFRCLDPCPGGLIFRTRTTAIRRASGAYYDLMGLLSRTNCVAKTSEVSLAVDVRRAWPVATVEFLNWMLRRTMSQAGFLMLSVTTEPNFLSLNCS